MTKHFGDRLIRRVREIGHPLCVGLDPHLDPIPEPFRRGGMRPGHSETARAVEAFLMAVLDRVGERVAIVKPQIAFFEALGPPGFEVLGRVAASARERGLLVLLDAKRGDIGSTAEAYARAYLAAEAPLPVDAITINPYLGTDTLEPFLSISRQEGRGVFVLTRTSNPGSAEFQDRSLEGAALFERVAESLGAAAERMRGETGWSSLGVVAGATFSEPMLRIRKRLPHSPMLVPGYGAQGGSASDAVRGFVPGPDGRLEGGIVNASRAILYPKLDGAATVAGWESAIDAALTRAIDDLRRAIS